ncbi:MAG TPA: hypothetical protein VMD75_03145 [Candidatus Binataceae bacterium]|nr:hypothetical protein [Candidatus Binataceae bacterium]HTY56732.1 hypothetical protein [Candidatus Binataceae bacterium]
MGRVIVLNEAARAVRSRSVLLARRRHQLHLVPRPEPDTSRPPSAADKFEKVVWVVALWALFVAYIVVLTPPDLGRSVVRFQSKPVQIASPSANTQFDHSGPTPSSRFYAAIR